MMSDVIHVWRGVDRVWGFLFSVLFVKCVMIMQREAEC